METIKQPIITLRRIRDTWISTSKYTSRNFCQAILPECYSSESCESPILDFDDGGVADSTLNAIMRGNCKTSATSKAPAPRFTNHFIDGIIRNPVLPFKDKSLSKTFRESMFGKIHDIVTKSGFPNNSEDPLLQHPCFNTANYDIIVQEEYGRLESAITEFLKNPTPITISYSIFLLITAAIVQDNIALVSFLYEENNMEQVFAHERGSNLVQVPSNKHRVFYDPHYFTSKDGKDNKNSIYHVYLFRETNGELIKKATLQMTQDSCGKTEAILKICDTIQSPGTENQSFSRTYKGTPIISPVDETINIAMVDEHDSFGMLSIPYRAFKFQPMYFRTGFFLKSSTNGHVPSIRKIVITMNPVPNADLPYVKGLLKLDYDQIMISQNQLDIFEQQFRNYPWMPDFIANYKRLLEAHKISTSKYLIHSDEILSCSISDLEPNDRLKVLLALKSIDSTNSPDLHKFVHCLDPKSVHKIFKYGAKQDDSNVT